jgi:hypothetical protein
MTPDAGRKPAQRTRRLLVGLMMAVLPAAVAAAQSSWPVNPVRLIMPYPPASSGDLITRKVAPYLAQKFGAPFFVENRPGANGNIGMKTAKDAAPDGYAFVSASDIQFAVSPVVYANIPYDFDRDFTPVAPLARVINVIVATKNLPANNLKELVALAKADAVRSSGAAPVCLRARLAAERSIDVGQSLHTARAHRFQRRRAPPHAAADDPGREAGLDCDLSRLNRQRRIYNRRPNAARGRSTAWGNGWRRPPSARR